MASGFVPPPYPYDRLDQAQAKASALEGGLVDLSIGTPYDAPPAAVVAALGGAHAPRGDPAGGLDDLGAVAAWGRSHDVPVFSDECYAEFTWDGPPRSILEHGLDGLVAVHSLSKRSNLAGVRAGFYAGDPDLVHYLSEV